MRRKRHPPGLALGSLAPESDLNGHLMRGYYFRLRNSASDPRTGLPGTVLGRLGPQTYLSRRYERFWVGFWPVLGQLWPGLGPVLAANGPKTDSKSPGQIGTGFWSVRTERAAETNPGSQGPKALLRNLK